MEGSNLEMRPPPRTATALEQIVFRLTQFDRHREQSEAIQT